MPFKLAAKCRYENDAKAQKIWIYACAHKIWRAGTDTGLHGEGKRLLSWRRMLYYAYMVPATNDYAPMRKMIDDFLRTSFINEGLVTCANCSFMQEIAEYPFMMFLLLILEERAEQMRNL
ncbi:MAG: hypothetical protein ACLUKN_11325 [Bacilli bacterium]